jgi:tetratricopeptide (TPR) repeat protein
MSRALVLASVVLAALAHAGPIEDSLSAAERDVMKELDQGHLIKARDAAEKVLKADPDSFAACWAMARVHHDEEGNHARSLYFLKRATTLLKGRDPAWGKRLLLEEYDVVFEMARNEDALAVLDRYKDTYGPPPEHLRIWPLFKLGRDQEARAIATRLAASSEWEDRSNGYNGMLSIAFEAHDRELAYKWAIDGVRATQDRSCTILRNTAGTAYTMFKLGEAEELSIRAAKAQDCTDSVYNQLASLYLLMGDPQKALSALNQARSMRIEKRYRPQFALVRKVILSDLMTVMGKHAEAARLAADLYVQPARTGMVSSSVEIERLARSMRYAFALDNQIRALREEVSFGPLVEGRAQGTAEVASLAATRWEVRRALVQLLAEEDRVVLVARPNLGEMTDWATWHTADLAPVVGVGVLRAAISRAREADAPTPQAAAYLDALEGELDFKDGEYERAVKLAGSALTGLPREEALLRWRTLTWQADALWQLGRGSQARAAWGEVLQRWPTAVRLLDLKLPVTLVKAGGEAADETATRLRRSSRFEVRSRAPFGLRVDARAGAVDICLLEENGTRLACASGENPTAALSAFHAAAFSPRVNLSETDLRSLDGSPVRVGADEALKKVLAP